MIARLWCRLAGHRWMQERVIEASFTVWHDVWRCTRCGTRNEARLTTDDLT